MTRLKYTMHSAASVTENICPGAISNGFLEHQCLRDPLVNTCFYTCAEGFTKLNFRPVHRGDILNNYHSLKCVDGVWTTGLEHVGFRLQDICVPEGNFTHATMERHNCLNMLRHDIMCCRHVLCYVHYSCYPVHLVIWWLHSICCHFQPSFCFVNSLVCWLDLSCGLTTSSFFGFIANKIII